MFANKKLGYFFLIMVGFMALSLVYSPVSQAQNWIALPPYNTLWPLWAPALSPIDPSSGLPTPIVNELTPNTILPVQPGLTWDPAAANPWLLYNTPLGMAYYDPVGGVNLWPPSYLLDPFGGPLPISLPLDYAYLPPTSSSWINTYVPLGNIAAWNYLMTIPGFTAPIGPLGPITTPPLPGVPYPPGYFLNPSALLPVAPPAVAPLPVPTVVAPLPVPTAITPLPVPTAIAPLPVPTVVAPTVLAPTAIAPLPAPTAIAPTVLAPTAVAPTAIILQLTAPTAVALPTTTVAPAVISGLLFPFI